MDPPSNLSTSASLLARLARPEIDQEAWAEFVRRYGPLLYRWCRHWHVQEADAQDVAQAVLTRLVAKLQAFHYDATRSFRAYLKALTGYAWRDLLEARRRAGAAAGGSAYLGLLETVEARDDLTRRLEAEFDRELLEEATLRVRARVAGPTWEAFRLTALEGLSGAEAAARLGMNVYTVFKAKNRVQKLLQAEVAQLGGR
jgi:RNA polymerase sigma-70 factor (ECF subfamily)